MSRRGKRGVAACLKKLGDDELHIEFDEDMLPKGSKNSYFASELGLILRARFPYHIETKQFDKQMWEDLWSEVKEHWNIQDDKPKKVLIKKAKKNCTNWRSFLVREFVNKNKLPFAKYDYLDSSKWGEFVAAKTSDAFVEKSNKAKISARANKDFARTGRTGYMGLKDNFDTIWPELIQIQSDLKYMQNECSQLHIAARKNKQTGLYEIGDMHEKIIGLTNVEREMKEDGTYYEGCEDPITRYLGAEHVGRSRTVSDVIGSTQVHGGLYKGGRKQNQNGVPTTRIKSDERVNLNRKRQRVDASPGFRRSSCASGGSFIDYPDIQSVYNCDLLWPYDLTFIQTVSKGQAHFTSDRSILLTDSIHEDCLKVQVDTVMLGYERMPVPVETRTDEVNFMEDTLNGFIRWPINAVKFVNTEAPHKSMGVSRKAPSHSASSRFQSSPQTHTCDIETSTQGYIPQPPEVNQVQQQMPSINDMDTDNFVDFLIATTRVNPFQ